MRAKSGDVGESKTNLLIFAILLQDDNAMSDTSQSDGSSQASDASPNNQKIDCETGLPWPRGWLSQKSIE
jgi:hypothetical protein